MKLTSFSPKTASNLFLSGAIIGPVVDSLHNQCLLKYNFLPLSLYLPSDLEHTTPFFCSSWAVPPLLGFAYVVLGGILPRLFQSFLNETNDDELNVISHDQSVSLRTKALLAVTTTALIIKISEVLETNTILSLEPTTKILLLLTLCLSQWAWLDGTFAALIAASITSIGGPLSELPFVAQNAWNYLPSAADYFPLQNLSLDSSSSTLISSSLAWVLGDDYQQLALSSITGPCYFAVTMDAIAIGRWLDHENFNKD